MKGKKTQVDFDLIIKLNKEGHTTSEIAKILEIPQRTLSGIINRNNLPIQKRLMKSFKNENYFETIDSSIKAYLFGFLIADGYITKDNKGNDKVSYRFGMEILDKDDIVIKTLAQELNMLDYICYRSPRENITINGKSTKGSSSICSFRCTSKKIVFDLIKLGMDFNKTSNENLTVSQDLLQGEYFFDFLRGLIDGDGTLTSEIGSVAIYGLNKQLFEDISVILKNYYSNIILSIKKEKHSDNCYTFRISGGGVNSLEYINKISSKIWYNNCFCLERKFPKNLNQENSELTK